VGQKRPVDKLPAPHVAAASQGLRPAGRLPRCAKGLVTAEEAQDYPTTPATPEPVVVRPKFDEPAPAAEHEEKADRFAIAKAAIEAEDKIPKLDAMRPRIDALLHDGTFTPFQADELLDMIHAKVEFLEAEQEVTA